MPNHDVPPTRRALTQKQQRAADLLMRYLKDAHENIHGPGSWLRGDDENVRQIVEDLTDPNELAKHVTRRIHERVSRA